MSVTEVARLFDVSRSSLSRWRQQQRTTGTLTPGQSPGRPRSIGTSAEPALAAQVATTPDATLAEHCAQWATRHGVTVSPPTMGRTLQRLGLPLKKRP
jgi:transposase